MTLPWARFDDLQAHTALLFAPPDRVLATSQLEDVAGILAEVERCTAAGAWAFGYLAYEAAPAFDPGLPVMSPSGEGPPLAWFGLCGPPRYVPAMARSPRTASHPLRWFPTWNDEEYGRAVTRVRAHIAAGETYQCNLTDRLHAEGVEDPEALYTRLALAQRGSYNAYLDLGRHVIASASPELFFQWQGDEVRTRPMKGTAPRGSTTAEDHAASHRLLASAKERAENLMIVDLLRNDLSRVSRIGSVRVPQLFTLERYPTVWQMTSEVSAVLRPDVGLVDVFRALFPCGSVTGAPKQSTMGLIRDLERRERGVYCGAIGVVAPPAAPFRARFSVAIRTAVIDRLTGQAVYGVGSGITWDSDPKAERAELKAKAAVLSSPAGDHELIETLRYSPTHGLRNLDRHLTRLADSAAYFGFACNAEEVRAAIELAVDTADTDTRVRVLLHRCHGVRVRTEPLPAPSVGPVTLVIDAEPVEASSVWLRHKTTRRDAYRTRAARHPEAQQVVLVNERGEVTETTVANLAVRLDGTWWTPPVASGCLPGVERGRLLGLGTVRERVLHVQDLVAAEGLAVLSSLWGWRRALLVGRSTAGAPRPASSAPGMSARSGEPGW